MLMSEEMKRMVELFNRYDEELKAPGIVRSYIAPNIPEKVLQRLVKHYDNHLAANSVVAYYDDTLFGSAKSGLIFTTDGFYYKPIGKAMYYAYKDIQKVEALKNITMEVENCDPTDTTVITCIDTNTLKRVIDELKKIDEEYGQSSFKTSGKVKKINLPPEKMKQCHAIIHAAAVICGGVGTGLAQLPCADNAAIVPIQITMIVGLGKVFDLNITESVAKSIVASAGATIAGRTASQVLVGWIPVIGNAINTATAAGVTETIGWLAVNNFYNRWIEDKNKGRLDGMKDGYVEASGEYERKLKCQAEAFLTQQKDAQREHEEYEHLLDEYEKYIKELEVKCAAVELLREVKADYYDLKNLGSK